jgi:precorrin-6B methylase 2
MFSEPGKVIEQLFVAEGMTVADFGAGAGFYVLPLARRVGPYGRVFAIDVQPDHLRKIKNECVKEGMNQVEVIMGDLESPKGSGLVSASVDRIVISNVLFQSENPSAVVKEAKRVLKHNGKIAVVEWIESYNQIGPHSDHVLTQEEARDIFEAEGFMLESFIDAGSHHYGLLYVHANTPVPGTRRNMSSRNMDESNPAGVLPPQELQEFSHNS